jgi:predicted PurR-regulated permease PerM
LRRGTVDGAVSEEGSPHVAYRAVLLAAGLLLFGLLFRQLVTLLLAILITIVVAIPLAAAATRLERYKVPRPLGALLGLVSGLGVLALIITLLIPPFIDQTNEFVDNVPNVVDDLENTYADWTGEDPGQVGDRVQEFVEKWTDDPEKLIGPITSIGLNIAGVLAALILILITAYYMAIRPEPLVDGLVSLFPPPRREHARFVLERIRRSWIGWMEGVAIDMLVTFVLLWIGLTIIGLDYAVFFAVLSALLVVVPYFGSIAGAVPPVLFALTDSPGKAVLALVVYIAVQQFESNITIPLVMSQRVRMHPAMVAIGVVVVGQLFGFVGLFVAVPILSLIVITTDEFWVKPIEERYERRRYEGIELPSGELDDRDDHPDHDEDDDQDLDDDPEAGQLHRRAPTR